MNCTMIVEQTKEYKKRMCYVPETNSFYQTEKDSLFYVRKFPYPYGWIKESGTPPEPHWDVILMSDINYEIGESVEIKIIGVFQRNDGDHKFISVEQDRKIKELSELNDNEKSALNQLFPRVDEGEGWFGQTKAIELMNECEKAL